MRMDYQMPAATLQGLHLVEPNTPQTLQNVHLHQQQQQGHQLLNNIQQTTAATTPTATLPSLSNIPLQQVVHNLPHLLSGGGGSVGGNLNNNNLGNIINNNNNNNNNNNLINTNLTNNNNSNNINNNSNANILRNTMQHVVANSQLQQTINNLGNNLGSLPSSSQLLHHHLQHLANVNVNVAAAAVVAVAANNISNNLNPNNSNNNHSTNNNLSALITIDNNNNSSSNSNNTTNNSNNNLNNNVSNNLTIATLSNGNSITATAAAAATTTHNSNTTTPVCNESQQHQQHQQQQQHHQPHHHNQIHHNNVLNNLVGVLSTVNGNNNNNNNNSNNNSNNNNINGNSNNNHSNNNNNNNHIEDNNRWTQFQVQQLWKQHASYLNGRKSPFLGFICKTNGKSTSNSKEVICGDDKYKEEGDLWNVEAQTAFLGPNLWDKTLPYDADLKVTQYADLDEFLSENNIPDGLPGTHLSHATGLSHRSDSLGHAAGLTLGLGHITTKRERSPSPSDCISPDTLNPPSPAESTFSFASSGRDFDPRTRAFSDEELKPQPMIKKSRKQFVPDELKDDKYWARRRKNNIAAKRSRDARRQKENQIAMRARYLEKENATLHQEVEQLKQENMDLRARLSKFQDV